jgi:hypothetical protein
MIKVKVEAYWKPHPDLERIDEFYVDEYNEEIKKYIYDRVRKHFMDGTPDDEELEKYYSLTIEVGKAVYLCDLCGYETEKLYFISLMADNKTYDVCFNCYQKVGYYLEQLKKENLKWKINILGNK